MQTITKHEALQNAANDLGIKIYQRLYDDKRRSCKFFAEIAETETPISPVLDYDQMNHFLIGWRRAAKYLKNESSN